MTRSNRDLSELETLLLSTLIQKERYGLEMLAELKEANRVISIGGLYVALARMEKDGFVSSRWGEATEARHGARRRYYKLTALGTTTLKRALDSYAAFDGARQRLREQGA
jgi:DNA-binding PadR family transcriptional regulator